MAAITLSTTDKRDGKALALFARCAEWQQGKTKDGKPFFAIPSSEANAFHMTNTRECSCADFQKAGNRCKHVRAVCLWMAAFMTGSVAPKPRTDATPLDERVALTPEGAAQIAGQADASLWHHCETGCGELLAPEHTASLCNHCAAKQTPRSRATYSELFAAELAEA